MFVQCSQKKMQRLYILYKRQYSKSREKELLFSVGKYAAQA